MNSSVANASRVSETSCATSSGWNLFTEHRPTVVGLYWWRVPARDYGGVVLQMEFVARVSAHGMGHADAELYPEGVSHWNGYERSVPELLEWRAGDATNGAVRFPGLHLKGCPFCGGAPVLTAQDAPSGGGVYLTGGRVWQANAFEISHCGARYFRRRLADAAELWNRRAPKVEPQGSSQPASDTRDGRSEGLKDQAAQPNPISSTPSEGGVS